MLSFEEAQQHPHIKARETFVEIEGMVQAAPAPRFSRTSCEVPERPRMAGEDTRDVLVKILSLRDADVNSLLESGVVDTL